MNRIRRLVVVLAFVTPALSFAPPQDEKIVVRALRLVAPEFDDLGRLLHIEKITGEYELGGKISSVGIVMEAYKKGVLSGEPIRSSRLLGSKPEDRMGRFTIQIADLDYLKLGDAPKGLSRVFIAFKEGASSGWSHVDIPKSQFDFSAMRSGGGYADFRPVRGRIPLFWKLSGTVQIVTTGETPEEVLRKNPDADILRAYLEVE
jgi:hypothetical protein